MKKVGWFPNISYIYIYIDEQLNTNKEMNNQKRKEIQEVFESLPTSACYKEAAFMMELSKVTEDPIERDNFIHSHHIGMNVWRKKVWLK